MRLLGLVILAVTTLHCNHVHAGGLIFRLPPDGTRVTYDYYQKMDSISLKGYDQIFTPKELEEETKKSVRENVGSLSIASVGTENVSGEPCRWIEIVWVVSEKGVKDDVRKEASQFLIPEKYLTADADPLDHVLKVYHTEFPGKWELRLMDREEHQKIEIERFRQVFPKPASKANRINDRVPDQKIKTPLGIMNCELRVFDNHFDAYLYGPAPCRWQWSGIHRLWLSDDAPFGVVALELVSETQQINVHLDDKVRTGPIQLRKGSGSSLQRLELRKIEKDVKSIFPAHK
jgi:hypothetical protein